MFVSGGDHLFETPFRYVPTKPGLYFKGVRSHGKVFLDDLFACPTNVPSKCRSVCQSHQSYGSANHISLFIQCNFLFKAPALLITHTPSIGCNKKSTHLHETTKKHHSAEFCHFLREETKTDTRGFHRWTTRLWTNTAFPTGGASKSCLMTVAPKAKAGTPAKEPPNLPTAVRLTFGSFEEGGQLRFSLMWLDFKYIYIFTKCLMFVVNL